MPFRLKNAGATYQTMVNIMFVQKIRHIIEVYVDDMFSKSFKPEDPVKDLWDTFDVFRKYKIRLNLAKCIIGVS